MELKRALFGQRLLVVAPHPDDEVISAGGLIARVKEAGGEAFVMVVSMGDLLHYDGTGKKTRRSTRRNELADAMRFLEVDDFEVLYTGTAMHLRMDAMPRRDLVERIERTARLSLQKIRPTMLVLPAPSYNQDHEAVHRAGITATRPHLGSMKAFQRIVLVADAPQLSWGAHPFRPNFYIDISDILETKLEAFRRHRSQQRPSPHSGGVDALAQLARMRGREISVEAAEAFECLRFVA